ncbi:IS3 family transposase [Pararhodobacter sp.]|uniref:IS3 family transposase n=1 Tax=Pararhodobacter sp. TaxID=2127056 RepID=UPI003A599116
MEHAQKKKTSKPYSPEFRERAVRLAMEHRDDYQSEAAALTAIAGKLGCSPDSLRVWMRQVQRDGGERPGPTGVEIARIKELERENRELRQANEILRKASAYFCPGGARPPVSQIIDFIEESREAFGVEPICRALQFAPSTYYDRRAIARDPDRASARAKSDAALSLKIDAAWDANRKLYGARKVWHVLRRQGEYAARCTVERLMRRLGLRGVVRGKKVITTNPDASLPCPDDKVNRLFMADRPNKLWVSDFTYVPTWSGTVYVAFVIDVFARRIVGWRTSTSMKTQFVLDALDQAIWQRKTPDNKSLVHHSDRGSQYLSIKYTERLAEAEIDLSVGTVGDAYDNALAECVIGLFKTEVINQIGPWKSMREVEWETLKWVDWYNNRRLLGPIGYIPPAEAEEAFYANLNTLDMVA